jgi:RNA polymerase sigma-70 factor (ECF subfamily)
MSYEEAARVCGTNVGTIKSRMNRARSRLAELLHVAGDDDLGATPTIRAVIVVEATVGAVQRMT